MPSPLPLLLLLLLLLSSAANGTPSFLLEAARRDVLRHQSRRLLHAAIHHRRAACELNGNATHSSSSLPRKAFSLPLISGAFTGTGEYFARFLVGTPAQRFLLILDTGSDLTWVKCKANNETTTKGGRRAFLPANSSTFEHVPCSSTLCKSSLPFSLTECPTSSSPCLYDYAYSDGSKALGLFGVESATVRLSSPEHHRVKLPGIVLGCTSNASGTSFRAADGVLGVDNSPSSFAAAAAARLGSARFAYCLVDHLSPKNATGFVSFGAATKDKKPTSRLQHAALLADRQVGPFYGVQVLGISVDGKPLNISRDVWNASLGGGVITDTGTSLTLLAEPAYAAVAAALRRALARYPRVDLKPFELCYNTTGGFDEGAVPRLAVRMAAHGGGEARLEPPAKSYVVDVADGVKCVGVLPATSPGPSTLGNIIQQGYYWEFDVEKGRLSFGPSSC